MSNLSNAAKGNLIKVTNDKECIGKVRGCYNFCYSGCSDNMIECTHTHVINQILAQFDLMSVQK